MKISGDAANFKQKYNTLAQIINFHYCIITLFIMEDSDEKNYRNYGKNQTYGNEKD